STTSTRGILPIDPTSPAPADPLSVLPHILLFIVLLLAFYPPPFRFRRFLICTLVALLDWRSTVSPWPPNIDDTRPLKYGIASSWIFVLPVVQTVLIHLPEKDFWRLDEEEVVSELREDGTVVKTHRPSPPREWSWNKLRWSVSLFATPRAVGWNFGGRKINSQREEIRRARLAFSDTGGGAACKIDDEMVKMKVQFPRAQFVVVKLFRAFVCYLVWDLVAVANRRVITPRGEEWWSWEPEIMVKILWLEILMGITVYVGMNMQFDVAAAIGVGLRLNEPEDWPPLFGSITDCYTIANVWGKFWHQYMRQVCQPCLGTSHFLLTHLNMLISRLPRCLHIPQIPKHSLVAYIFHLLTAFAISTFFHALSVGTVAVGITPVRGIIKNMAIFFMIQPFAAAFESLISTSYDKFVVARLLSPKLAPGRNVQRSSLDGNTREAGTAVSDGDIQDGHSIAPTITNNTTKTDISLIPSQHTIEGTEASSSGEETDANKDAERSQSRRMSAVFWSAVVGRMVGYIWVLFWFYLTGQWFIRPYIDVGIVEWGLPFSFADWLLLPEGCR
ncbi:hypothetical protein V8F06_009857, partial [Rhypophila decipiens]